MTRMATALKWTAKAGNARSAWLAGALFLAACTPTVTATPPVEQPPLAAPRPRVEAATTMATAIRPNIPNDGKIRVALLVPLSGNAAATGAAMLEAAQLALFDVADERFVLIPRDTRGSVPGATEAARRAVADGARLILGPLFSADVAAVRNVAQSAGISVLAFTNDASQGGNGVYVLGFGPGEQINRVVAYARGRGLTRFGLLAPRSPYGEIVANALTQTLKQLGGQLTREERYDPNIVDLTPSLRRLIESSPVGSSRSPGSPMPFGNAPIPVTPSAGGGDTGFDALVIAESGGKLSTIVRMLPGTPADPTRVKLIGAGIWDDPAVWRESALAGGWYAAPAPDARADFEARFESLYHRKPARLATLAYDVTALAAVLAKTADATAQTLFDPAALSNPNGFSGVDGIFRLRADGQADRGLAVLEITPAGPRAIDPAPTSFQPLTQ
ncbi:Amino acid/amide ABC transporter substrate-binding protein (HAAT family) [Azospirillaceae bacterium]